MVDMDQDGDMIYMDIFIIMRMKMDWMPVIVAVNAFHHHLTRLHTLGVPIVMDKKMTKPSGMTPVDYLVSTTESMGGVGILDMVCEIIN